MKLAHLILIIAIFAAVFSTTVNGDEIRVAAASNSRGVLAELTTRFEAESGHELVLIFGSTGKHYAQIINGAPFDVFLAADTERPRKLEEAGHIAGGTRFTWAVGRLALWSDDASLLDGEDDVLKKGQFRHLAIANPRLAPYGRAAKEALENLGHWDKLQPQLVMGENVGQAYQFVKSGNAELGLVAWSQIKQGNKPLTGSWWLVPESLHAPINQQAAQLRPGSAANAFLTFLRGEKAVEILSAHGYGVPDDL